MDVKGNRLTGLLVLFISLLAALAVAALFYFLKIQQNEHYQNQLHFRELNRYVESLEQNKQSLEAAYDAYHYSQANYDLVFEYYSQLQELKKYRAAIDKKFDNDEILECKGDGCSSVLIDKFVEYYNAEINLESKLKREISDTLRSEFSYDEEVLDEILECVFDGGNIADSVSNIVKCRKYISNNDVRTLDNKSQSLKSTTHSMCQKYIKVCLNKRERYIQAGIVDGDIKPRKFSEILKSSNLIPLVLFVDSTGVLLHKNENLLNDSSLHGLRFEQVEQLLRDFVLLQSKSNENKSVKDISPVRNQGGSDFIDTTIAGTEYRVFLQPWAGIANESSSETEMLYLVGLQSRSAMLGDKLAVSNSLVLIFTSLLIGIIALLPLLKVRLVSTQQGFSSNDLKVIPLSLAIITALLSISTFQYIFYNGVKTSVDNIAQAAFSEIKLSFSDELKIWEENSKNRLQELKLRSEKFENEEKSNLNNLNFENKQRCSRFGPSSRIDCLFSYADDQTDYLEGIYEIDSVNKSVKELGAIASKNQKRKNAYSVSDRQYVMNSASCTGWYWPPDKKHNGNNDCRKTFFVERLRNKIDLRLNTWVGMPQFEQLYSENEKAESKKIIIFGGQLKTLFLTVMPKDFRFLVFDSHSGEVLYHSDEWLSKIDNIFADTDNDLHLMNLAKLKYDQPKHFETQYKGKDTVFHLGAIAENVPWTLVVMYDKSPYRLLNLLSAFSSWTLSFFYLLLLYIIWRVLPCRIYHKITGLIWFRADRHVIYTYAVIALLFNLLLAYYLFWFAADLILITVITSWLIVFYYFWADLSKFQYFSTKKVAGIPIVPTALSATDTKGNETALDTPLHNKLYHSDITTRPLLVYSAFILLLLLNLCSIPSILFSYQSSEYLLYRQSELNGKYLEYSLSSRKKEMHQYIDEFYNAEIFNGTDKNEVLQQSTVNCYPKVAFESIDNNGCNFQINVSNIEAETLEKSAIIFNSNTVNNVFFGKIPWLMTDVKLPMFSHIWALQQNTAVKALQREIRADINKILNFASSMQVFWTCVLNALTLILLLLLIRYWLCRRMMGLDRVENFRINPESIKETKYQAADALRRILYPHRGGSGKAVYLQLIRPSVAAQTLVSDHSDKLQAVDENDRRKDECLIAGINPVDVCDLLQPKKASDSIVQPDKLPTMVLTGFEALIWNKVLRQKVLKKLQQLVSNGKVNLVLMMEMSPLYRLTQPSAYDEKFPVDQQADAAECDAWVKFFVRFIKIYDWVPKLRHKPQLDKPADVLWYEANSWPELEHVAIQFLAYHCAVKDPKLEDELKLTVGTTNYYCSELAKYWQNFCLEFRSLADLPPKKRLRYFKSNLSQQIYESINKKWTKEQIIDFFNSTAATRYEAKWHLCTIKEKVLLISMINGDLPNPRNSVPLEHLVRRGYIYYDQGWHIVNESFARFVITAEDPDTVRRWMREVSESLWKYARIPLFIGLLLLLGLLAYTATDSLQSLMALMATMLGIIPVIFNNINLFKGSSNSGS